MSEAVAESANEETPTTAVAVPTDQLIANRTQDSIELTNGIRIEVRPCTRVSVRGITSVSIVAEEIGHWFTAADFANPDVEVLAAVRPTLLTTRGPMLMASCEHARLNCSRPQCEPPLRSSDGFGSH